MTSPLRGFPAILASLPEYCLPCGGRRVVSLRATTQPKVTYGRLALCPHCSAGQHHNTILIPLVPWRTDTPREAAA